MHDQIRTNMKQIPKARFHHVYTKGLEDNIIFRDREDYTTGMNHVALCTFCTGINMLAFTLMSNHFHFIVHGKAENVKRFIDMYKTYISRYIYNKYRTSSLLRHVKTGCKTIENSGDALKTAIAYVLRNHIKAGINQSVQGYEWSSGRCYFAGSDLLEGSRSVSELGIMEYRRIMHSKTLIEGQYRINRKGYIDPASYICIDFVESCFGRVQSLDFFIYKSGSSRPKEGPVDFSDELVMAGLREILNKKYEVTDISELKDVLKRDVILTLKRQFNCGPKQLARITKMSLRDVHECLT